MKYTRLRDVLEPLVSELTDSCTHSTLPDLWMKLGLPAPNCEGSKCEKIKAAYDALPDADLPFFAKQLLKVRPPHPTDRNVIQDILWADKAVPTIPKRYRRDVARKLSIDDLYNDAQRFDKLLDSLWVLDDPINLFSAEDHSIKAMIKQHVHRNPGDWSVEELFDKLGALDAPPQRFAFFLEGLASSDVLTDEAAQRHFVEIVNEPLRKCGAELCESHIKDGYPVFRLVSTHMTPRGQPKNLIFASPVKPDLRFRDAVNNDIEIVTNADKVLVYDRPIGIGGLSWDDLQRWWSETNGITDHNQAKKTLYRRLYDSLPKNSPPQASLFQAFYRGFGKAVPKLPALLPEVWLHWDPKTVTVRGPDALLRFRMDFLLLLPNGSRVILEVDGKHHFAHENGRADATRYAAMMAADRELKLAGYEVFRFGAEELLRKEGPEIAKRFFKGLFSRYGIPA